MSRTKGNRTITIPQTDQEEDDDMYSFEDDTNLELESNSNTDVTEYFNSSGVKSSRFTKSCSVATKDMSVVIQWDVIQYIIHDTVQQNNMSSNKTNCNKYFHSTIC